ncbi:MAG: hypothetical protein GY697_28090 [Desulfobacterales bacterium]|nr:hypothetical protein [Desulfobacterales bacterium]
MNYINLLTLVVVKEPHPNEYMRNHHDMEMLLVMERILYSSSLACIESALHGLNHWVGNYREWIHQIIDKFLSNRGELPPEIHEQAEWAKKGTMP